MSVIVGKATLGGGDPGGTALVTANGSDATLYTDASGVTAAGNNHVTVTSGGLAAFYAEPGIYDVLLPLAGGKSTTVNGVGIKAPNVTVTSALDVSDWPPADGDLFTFNAATGEFEPANPGLYLPAPTTGDAGKVPTVNEAEDGFDLDALAAPNVTYDHTVSGLTTTDVKAALDEITARVVVLETP